MRHGLTHCLVCAYDLAGLNSDACPECGGAFVDTEARRIAAGLVERFRDNLIPNALLLEQWPRSRADVALSALHNDLTTRFRDYRVAGLRVNNTPDRARVERLTRWAAFLRSGIDYPRRGDDASYPFADEAECARWLAATGSEG